MILRLADSLSRGVVVLAALIVGLWLSFFSIRAAVARYESEGNTARQLELAVRLEPRNFNYWYTLGRFHQYNLELPDSAQAIEDYRKAIALNPLATDAWLDLGTAYELDGETVQARECYLQAKKSYPISADVSWRYGNFLLREGEVPQAYAELRQAIDADPRRAAAAFSRAYRANPNIDQILTQLLPPKQSVYADVIAEAISEKQLAVAKLVWAQLIALNPHLTIREFNPLVGELLQSREFPEARRVWDQGTATQKLPPLLQPLGSVIWDPSFESGMSGSDFAWNFKPITQGVSIDFDKEEKLSGNQSLRLSFDGKHNPNLDAACTLAIVQPDVTYQFSAWIKTRAVTSDHGLKFRLRSFDAPKIPTLDTVEVFGTTPWTLIQQSWSVGPGAHRVQVCVARDPSENPEVRISGIAWVDDVNLVPQPAEHHKP